MRHKVKSVILIIPLFLSIIFPAANESLAAEVHVFAAASLTEALKEIGPQYERKSGDKIIFNFGASSTLARQIQEGAPADVFISADEAKMNVLEEKGVIKKETRKSLLSNSLVIVIAQDSAVTIKSARDLVNFKRIAVAEPRAVPAGIYAKEYLQKIGVWEKITDALVPTENVRAALAAVESGNVDAGIVYKTDAAISKKVKIAFEVPAKESPKISYPFAVVKEGKQADVGEKFLKYLGSDAALKVFEKYGFLILR